MLLLAIAGILPLIGCALAAMALAEVEAAPYLAALIGYGALVLAFLGGIHWGVVLQAPEDSATTTRLVLGVGISLIGWAALLAPLVLPMDVALAVLIAGYVIAVVIEARQYRAGQIPGGYIWLRWALSVIAVVALAMVLILRLLGSRIIF
jgi:hypothetical protein